MNATTLLLFRVKTCPRIMNIINTSKCLEFGCLSDAVCIKVAGG